MFKINGYGTSKRLWLKSGGDRGIGRARKDQEARGTGQSAGLSPLHRGRWRAAKPTVSLEGKHPSVLGSYRSGDFVGA